MNRTVDLATLRAGAAAGRSRSHAEFAELAAACRRAVDGALADWVAAGVAAKGWATVTGVVAEEWCSGPLLVARFLRCVERLHRELAHGRLPELRSVTPTPGSRFAFAALPAIGALDRLVLAGYRARVDCADDTPRPPANSGDVALVLGAGNITATPVLDVLDQVFLAGRAAVLKVSPLHAGLVDPFERALAPLTAAGLAAVVAGDGDLGAALARDPAIAAVHLTGSAATWRSLRQDPALGGKVLTGEVGCCTPAFVLPVDYGERALRQVARHLAAYVAMNGGATCVAPRLLLTARGWPQRAALLRHVERELAALPRRVPFLPGTHDAFARASGARPTAEALAPTLRPDLDPDRDSRCFDTEHFAPVLCELALAGDSVDDWLPRAVAFVRERVFGALSAYVFAPPRARVRHGPALAAAVAALPHGNVAINGWTGIGFGLGTTPWGVPATADPEHGRGFARGALGRAAVRRVVVEAPLSPWPVPPWLPWRRAATPLSRALTRLTVDPSPARWLGAARYVV